MEYSKLTTWIGLTGLTIALAGCPAADDTGTDTIANPTTTNNTTSGTTSDDDSTGPATTAPGSTSEADSSDGPGSTSDASTGEEVCDPPCLEGQMCVGGECFGDPPPDMSDYGPCDMCAPGETPIGIMGIEGCFCSPSCDGLMSMCPTPNMGTGMAQCVLGPQGADPNQCALLCQLDGDDCPMGATCQDTGMNIGLCTHPTPA